MVIVWNYTAYAQLEQGHAPGVWNWSGPAGADAEVLTGVVCATLTIAHVVSASLSIAHVASGELSIEEC